MKPADLDAMKARIARAQTCVQTAAGACYETQFQAIGQDFVTRFSARGVKDPAQLEDEFLSLFVWVWSLKDYIKAAYEVGGLRAQTVEEEANACSALMFVADIANRVKHGTLRDSRSGRYAELVDVGFTLPMDAVRKITVAGPEVTVEVEYPERAQIQAEVVTRDGTRLKAATVLGDAMTCWETKLLPHIADWSGAASVR
jgi:hypothetical protein